MDAPARPATRRTPDGVFSTVAVELARPHTYVTSSTPGHGHLYLDVPMTWRRYRGLLEVLNRVGVVEDGFHDVAMQHRATNLFLPWVRKSGPAEPDPAGGAAPVTSWPGLLPLVRRAVGSLRTNGPELAPVTRRGGLLVLGEPGEDGVEDRAVPGTLDRTLYVRTEREVVVDYHYRTRVGIELVVTDDVDEAEIVSSRLRHGRMHAPTLDLDVRHDYDQATGTLALHLPMGRFHHWLFRSWVEGTGLGRVLPAV